MIQLADLAEIARRDIQKLGDDPALMRSGRLCGRDQQLHSDIRRQRYSQDRRVLP